MNKKTPLSILIVEDNPLTSKTVARHLEKFGTVIATTNAQEAVANTSVRNPDIIFLDIHYNNDDQNGFDVLSNILSANKDAFVVMFSGDKDQATIEKAMALGAKGFIPKPFTADDFTHYLSQVSSAR